MILGGDEFARTQRGNNNAYWQDNEISWFDWTAAPRNSDLFDFFRKAIAFTRRFSISQRRKFFRGVDLVDDQVPDLRWFAPDLGRPPGTMPMHGRSLTSLMRARTHPSSVSAGCSLSSMPTSSHDG
jgi:glycogen operon protein